MGVRFLIIAEVARCLFARNSVVRRLAWKLSVLLALIVSPLIVAIGLNQYASVHYVYKFMPPIVEQYLSLAQAVLLLILVAVAWYYRIRLTRPTFALVFGFGLYLSFCAMNFASLQAFRGFFAYWRLLYPTTFIMMLALWLRAFWNPELLSVQANEDTGVVDTRLKDEWNRIWAATLSILRRID